MDINIEHVEGGSTTVTVVGEMDALGCSDARPVLEQLTETYPRNHVCLDLEQVSFLDSSGIGAIVFLFKRLKAAGGDLSICKVRGQPRELMQLLRIDQAISVDWGYDEPVHAQGVS